MPHPPRDRSHLAALLLLWAILYATFTLLTPPLLDDADSVHAEVAREMLLRHDYVTLYANGIRYLEKAPVLYWSMAASMKLFGPTTAAARLPLAFAALALILVMESFARRAFLSTRAGLYAGLITLSSFGIFIFTRITIPDVLVCLWLTLALYAYHLTEQQDSPTITKSAAPPSLAASSPGLGSTSSTRLPCYAFATACALNVLTKGLIGIIFPATIVLAHLLLTRGPRNTLKRLRQLHPLTSIAVFLAIAAPWHILIALANPTAGHPGNLAFIHHHWQVPLPTDGNVHGWLWFYFVNEQLLRYLNLRVPRDYDTVPLYLFWGLLLLWIMPWSAFLFRALRQLPLWKLLIRSPLTPRESTLLLLGLWAAIPMLFFSLSTRQEYYVLPAIPALILLIAAWLAAEADEAESFIVPNPLTRAGQRIASLILLFGSLGSLAAGFFLLHAQPPIPGTDLSTLLHQNPADYALSFGHFLDLNAQAMGAFRTPLLFTLVALFPLPLAAWYNRGKFQPHRSNLYLAAAAITFLFAAHLGLQTFAPVLTSKPLADALALQLNPPGARNPDLIIIHGEYEAASTLGFYLQRPLPGAGADATEPIHIYNGRSSNLWYGSFFPDAPPLFEDDLSLQLKWSQPRRIFLWQDLTPGAPPLPQLPGKVFPIAQSGGKSIVSNQPNPY